MGAQIMLNRTPFGGNPLRDTSEVTTTTTTSPPTTTTTTMEPTTTALPRESFVTWELEYSNYYRYLVAAQYVETADECISHARITESK